MSQKKGVFTAFLDFTASVSCSCWQDGSNYLKHNRLNKKSQSENNFCLFYFLRYMIISIYVFVSFYVTLIWRRLSTVFRKIVFIGLCNSMDLAITYRQEKEHNPLFLSCKTPLKT